MALRGTLHDFGLADIFQLIGIQRKTGVLELAHDDRKVMVSFLAGSVVSADCTRPALEDRLGSLLVNSGKITEKQLNEALKVQKSTLKRLGRILVEQNIITPDDLRAALELQVTQIVYNLFRWRDGAYDFSQEETIDYDRDYFTPIPAENILMEGARMIDEWPIIERTISDFKMILRRTPRAKALADAVPVSVYETDIDFGLIKGPETKEGESSDDRVSDEQAALLRLVDGRSTVQEIIDRSHRGEFDTCRLLYELIGRGLIQEGEVVPPLPVASERRKRSILLRLAVITLPVISLVSLATSFRSPLAPVGGLDPFGVDRLRSHLSQARVSRIDRALRLFYLDRQALPSALEPLVSERFLNARDLTDPWGRPYVFRIRPSGYTITGFGPDGRTDETISAESRFLASDRLTLEGGLDDVTAPEELPPRPSGEGSDRPGRGGRPSARGRAGSEEGHRPGAGENGRGAPSQDGAEANRTDGR